MAQSGDETAIGRGHDAGRAALEFRFTPADLARVQRLMFAFSSVTLRDQKESMIYNRLSRRLRVTGFTSFKTYLDSVEQPGSSERESFVNALTTNLTSFFREPHHFELLAARTAARPVRDAVRVWCSACSTGQEAWSAAITLHESGCNADILASDIDTEVLRTAAAGIYRRDHAGGLNPARLRRYFLRGSDDNEGLIKVGPELRSMVKFQRRNLLTPPASSSERFDVIFCRNVAIYFDKPAQQTLMERLVSALAPGGLLFVGHSEMFPLGTPGLRPCGHTAYERVAARGAP